MNRFYRTTICAVAVLCCIVLAGVGCSTRAAAQKEQHFPESIVSMKEWGGIPAPDSVARKHTITSITLHHQGETFTRDRNVPAYLRNLQDWSRREKKWIDVPYHYIIDFDGIVYEGRDIRFAGDTNTQYDPAGHALVEVVGNYEDIAPNERQLETIVRLFAWLCRTYSVPPDSINGHKDVASGTVCPGKFLYPFLQSGFFRNEVKKELAKK
jgi:N-acetylmuramoyl-L-alanine amidase